MAKLQKAESDFYQAGPQDFGVPTTKCTSEIVSPSAMFLELMSLKPLTTGQAKLTDPRNSGRGEGSNSSTTLPTQATTGYSQEEPPPRTAAPPPITKAPQRLQSAPPQGTQPGQAYPQGVQPPPGQSARQQWQMGPGGRLMPVPEDLRTGIEQHEVSARAGTEDLQQMVAQQQWAQQDLQQMASPQQTWAPNLSPRRSQQAPPICPPSPGQHLRQGAPGRQRPQQTLTPPQGLGLPGAGRGAGLGMGQMQHRAGGVTPPPMGPPSGALGGSLQPPMMPGATMPGVGGAAAAAPSMPPGAARPGAHNQMWWTPPEQAAASGSSLAGALGGMRELVAEARQRNAQLPLGAAEAEAEAQQGMMPRVPIVVATTAGSSEATDTETSEPLTPDSGPFWSLERRRDRGCFERSCCC